MAKTGCVETRKYNDPFWVIPLGRPSGSPTGTHLALGSHAKGLGPLPFLPSALQEILFGQSSSESSSCSEHGMEYLNLLVMEHERA